MTFNKLILWAIIVALVGLFLYMLWKRRRSTKLLNNIYEGDAVKQNRVVNMFNQANNKMEKTLASYRNGPLPADVNKNINELFVLLSSLVAGWNVGLQRASATPGVISGDQNKVLKDSYALNDEIRRFNNLIAPFSDNRVPNVEIPSTQ